MKKVAGTIAIFCYLAVSCGFIVNAHYCMDRLASVHLFEKSPDVCGQCGMDTHQSDGCCRDEVSIIKLQQDQNTLTIASYDIPAPETIAIISTTFLPNYYQTSPEQRHFHNHSPPILPGQDINLLNGVFRI